MNILLIMAGTIVILVMWKIDDVLKEKSTKEKNKVKKAALFVLFVLILAIFMLLLGLILDNLNDNNSRCNYKLNISDNLFNLFSKQ